MSSLKANYKIALASAATFICTTTAAYNVYKGTLPDSLLRIQNDYLRFLDSLTLYEESCLLNIILFVIVLLLVFYIVGILISQELVEYFQLGTRYPRLKGILTLRAKFQRYYLVLNILLLFLVAVSGVCLNIFCIVYHTKM